MCDKLSQCFDLMLKNYEQHYQKILYLYMSWQNENELVSNDQSYEGKSKKLQCWIQNNR